MPELSPENKYELSQELVDREFQAWAAAGTPCLLILDLIHIYFQDSALA